MNIKNYFLEKDFKIIIMNNKIDIVNYTSIEHVSTNNISLKYEMGIINIIGENLVIKKLMNDEILITGEINNLEFR